MSRDAHSALTLFAGRFGSGKTETAINYAVALARGFPPGSDASASEPAPPTNSRVVLVDLDIVTPYFRSREATEAMAGTGVKVVTPSGVGQHLDTPAITPEILGAIEQQELPVVIDVGGDRQGARALGQFSPAIRRRGYTMSFVVNPYRPFTDTADGLAASIGEIEASARLKVSSLVSNPNLMGETTVRHILEGHQRIEDFSLRLGLPIAFVCIEREWAAELGAGDGAPNALGDPGIEQPMLILDRYFVMAWE
jgi:hypothetical protein